MSDRACVSLLTLSSTLRDVTHHLVGLTEIAQLLRVSRQRAHQLTTAAAFPPLVVELASGKVWHREDVERWARRTGRLPVEGDEE